jgi:hypothetical protein
MNSAGKMLESIHRDDVPRGLIFSLGYRVEPGGELAFAHPLLTAAAYNSMTLAKRWALHRRLAAVVDDPEPRGRHLALAADGPDPSVASALDAAARDARGRGAPAAGAELLELARRLTDRDDAAALHRRTLKASEYHFEADDAGTPRQ